MYRQPAEGRSYEWRGNTLYYCRQAYGSSGLRGEREETFPIGEKRCVAIFNRSSLTDPLEDPNVGGGGHAGYGGYSDAYDGGGGSGGSGSGRGGGNSSQGYPRPTPPYPKRDVLEVYKRYLETPALYKLLLRYHKQITGSPEEREYVIVDMGNGVYKTYNGVEHTVLLPREVSTSYYKGIVHTHPFVYKVPRLNEPPVYSTRVFTPADVRTFLSPLGAYLSAWLLAEKPRETYDLSELYAGLITERGVYVLTIDKQFTHEELGEYLKLVDETLTPEVKENWSKFGGGYETWFESLKYKDRDILQDTDRLLQAEEQYFMELLRDKFYADVLGLRLYFYTFSPGGSLTGRRVMLYYH